MDLTNQQSSYDRHADLERNTTLWPSCYAHPYSNDAWRHKRMLESALPLLAEFPGAKWMTVGDGNFGSDAHFLEKHGVSATATSISDSTLAEAKAKGLIREFRIENAEKISAADGAFDFVLCKECYHHFPRPAVAFYEMLRVATKGLILIEPFEGPAKPLDQLKTWIKKIFRKDETTLFEPAGNFIYRLSLREVEKMLTAMNYSCFAYRPFNDFYHPKLSGGDYRKLSAETLLTRIGVAAQDLLCFFKLMNHGLTACIVLKEMPSQPLQRRLRDSGYKMKNLPRNPYL